MIIRGSYGTIKVTAKGEILNKSLLPAEYADITKVDMSAYRAFERRNNLPPDLDETDIQLVGYWYKNPRGKGVKYSKAAAHARKDYVEVVKASEAAKMLPHLHRGPAQRTLWFTIKIHEEVDGRFTSEAICQLPGIVPLGVKATRHMNSPRATLQMLSAQMKLTWGTPKRHQGKRPKSRI